MYVTDLACYLVLTLVPQFPDPIDNENFCAPATSVNGSNETSSKSQRTKSHRDLHDTVFSNAFVSTPSGSLQSIMASPLAVSSDLIQTQEILATQHYCEQIHRHILSGLDNWSIASPSEELKVEIADMFLHRSQAALDTLHNDDLFVSYVWLLFQLLYCYRCFNLRFRMLLH